MFAIRQRQEGNLRGMFQGQSTIVYIEGPRVCASIWVYILPIKKPKPLVFKTNRQNPSFFETKENKAKRQGDSKKKGVQKRSENFLAFGRPKSKKGLKYT